MCMKKNFNPKNIFERFKGLFSIGVADILGGAISSLFWIYMATIMEAEAYGEVFYFFAIGNIAASFALLGSKNTIMVFVPKNIKLESTIFLFVIIASIIASFIIFIIFSNFEISLYVLGSIIFGLGISEILAKKLYSQYFTFLILQKLLMVGLSIGFYYSLGNSGLILGIGLSFFVYLFIIIKEFKSTRIDLQLLKPKLGFMTNSYGQNLVATFSNQTDKLMIAPLLGFALLGNYQLGLQFIAVFQLLPLIVLKFTLPHDASGNPNRNLKIITILSSIFFTFVILFTSPILIPIFFEKFNYVVDIIQILSFSLIPMTINTIFASKFLAAEKSKFVSIGMMILLLTNIIGILILGNIFGIIGVAISYVLATIAQTIFYYTINSKNN